MQLKVVTGNPGARPLRKGEPDPGGNPVKPRWLKGRGATLWNEVTGFAFWLTQADGYKLAAWCDRQAEFEKNREHWTAADRREHRSAGSELGLDPASRTRLGPTEDPSFKDDPLAKYLEGRRQIR